MPVLKRVYIRWIPPVSVRIWVFLLPIVSPFHVFPFCAFSISVPYRQPIPFIVIVHRPRVSITSFPIATANLKRSHAHTGVHPTSIRLGRGHSVRQMRWRGWRMTAINTLQVATMRGRWTECGWWAPEIRGILHHLVTSRWHPHFVLSWVSKAAGASHI